MFVIVLVFGSIFVLPIVGLIWFVAWRNRQRIAAQTPVWQQLAARYGGRFTAAVGAFGGNRVEIPGPAGPILLETRVVSRMDAFGSPYFRHGHQASGGTFTLVRSSHPAPGRPFDATGLIAPRGQIVTQPKELAVVFNGAMIDPTELAAAIDYVAGMTARIAQAG